MTLPYYMRLLCLCFATFFVVHALMLAGGAEHFAGCRENRRDHAPADVVAAAVRAAHRASGDHAVPRSGILCAQLCVAGA